MNKSKLKVALAALESKEPEQTRESEPAKPAQDLDRERDFWNPADWTGYTPPARYLREEDCQDQSKDFKVGDFWYDPRGPEVGWKPFMQALPHPVTTARWAI